MATRKKANKRPERAGRAALAGLAALALLFCAAVGWGAITANTVQVRRAEVLLRDLPEPFDGRTLLYAADIDLCGLNTAKKSADLFARLQALQPDALLLGGDYTSDSLLAILNRSGSPEADKGSLRERATFIQSLADFRAPLGKYAIRTPDDPDEAGLRASLEAAGITPLFDGSAKLGTDSEPVYLVGLTGEPSAIGSAARAAKRSDCVIALSPGPAFIPQIMINEAQGGGAWCDMVLTGHTHGGQVRLFGANMLSLDGPDLSYLKGWTVENGVALLTTTGVGCEGVNVRLGSRAEVWLITLRRGESLPDLR